MFKLQNFRPRTTKQRACFKPYEHKSIIDEETYLQYTTAGKKTFVNQAESVNFALQFLKQEQQQQYERFI